VRASPSVGVQYVIGHPQSSARVSWPPLLALVWQRFGSSTSRERQDRRRSSQPNDRSRSPVRQRASDTRRRILQDESPRAGQQSFATAKLRVGRAVWCSTTRAMKLSLASRSELNVRAVLTEESREAHVEHTMDLIDATNVARCGVSITTAGFQTSFSCRKTISRDILRSPAQAQRRRARNNSSLSLY